MVVAAIGLAGCATAPSTSVVPTPRVAASDPTPAADALTPDAAIAAWLDGAEGRSIDTWRAADRRLARRGKDVVPLVVRYVDDPAISRYALDVLAAIGPDAAEVAPVLARTSVARDDASVRLETIACMGPAALGEFQRILDERDASIRWRAVEALGAFGPDDVDVVALLVRETKDPERIARSVAIDMLAHRTAFPEVVVPALTASLGDEDVTLRRMAARSLQAFGPAAAPAVTALVRRLDESDRSVVLAAVEALGAIGPAAANAAPRLVEIARADPKAAERVLRAVAKIDLDVVRGLIDDPNAVLRAVAVSAAAPRFDWSSSIAELRAVLAGPAGFERDAVLALVKLDPSDPSALPTARGWLRGEDGSLRYRAVLFSGIVRDADAVPEIVKLLTFDNPYGSLRALESLGEIGPPAGSAAEDVAQFTRPGFDGWSSSGSSGIALARAVLKKIRPRS